MKTIDLELAKKYLHYDHETGDFFHKMDRKGGPRTGDKIYNTMTNGYLRVFINQSEFMAHRMAWALYYGEWPEGYIDHINGVRTDNRICNLRQCSLSQNSFNTNKKRKNKSGYRGVSWVEERKKWFASLTKDGKRIYLGYHENVEDAAKAYRDAVNAHLGEFSVFNNPDMLNHK